MGQAENDNEWCRRQREPLRKVGLVAEPHSPKRVWGSISRRIPGRSGGGHIPELVPPEAINRVLATLGRPRATERERSLLFATRGGAAVGQTG